jgi:hypothetical protein
MKIYGVVMKRTSSRGQPCTLVEVAILWTRPDSVPRRASVMTCGRRAVSSQWSMQRDF